MAKKTAVSILEEARASIKKNTWICSALDACLVSKKGKVKHMACAVGVLSLAAGGKAVTKQTREVPVGNFKWINEHADFEYTDEEPETITLTTYFATYPTEEWPKAAKQATQFLALAIPADSGAFGREMRVPEAVQGIRRDYDGHSTVIDPFGDTALTIYHNAITDYNDGHIKSAAEARKWFTQAIKLARSAK